MQRMDFTLIARNAHMHETTYGIYQLLLAVNVARNAARQNHLVSFTRLRGFQMGISLGVRSAAKKIIVRAILIELLGNYEVVSFLHQRIAQPVNNINQPQSSLLVVNMDLCHNVKPVVRLADNVMLVSGRDIVHINIGNMA